MKFKEAAEKAAWYSLGIIFPSGQALWANAGIRKRNLHIDSYNRFPNSEIIIGWKNKLTSHPEAPNAMNTIYEQESARRSILSNKAQASLSVAALLIAVFSFLTPVLFAKDVVKHYFPLWGIIIVAIYLLFAITNAFHALRLERYMVVELDELKELLENNSTGAISEDLGINLSAHRAAAIEFNRPISLIVTNFVDASFSNLRHSVVVLLMLPAFVWFLKTLMVFVKYVIYTLAQCP